MSTRMGQGDLDRLVQAEADRLAREYGRSRVDIPAPQPSGQPFRIVGMTDDIERAHVEVYPDGTVKR